MPNVKAGIDFLADIDLYNQEKPFAALASPGTVTVGEDQLHNLRWETHNNIDITDIRGNEDQYLLDHCGFQIVKYPGQKATYVTTGELEQYKRGTAKLLSGLLEATQVYCYEAKVSRLKDRMRAMIDYLQMRENVEHQRKTLDLDDPFLFEGPAKGVHIGQYVPSSYCGC